MPHLREGAEMEHNICELRLLQKVLLTPPSADGLPDTGHLQGSSDQSLCGWPKLCFVCESCSMWRILVFHKDHGTGTES